MRNRGIATNSRSFLSGADGGTYGDSRRFGRAALKPKNHFATRINAFFAPTRNRGAQKVAVRGVKIVVPVCAPCPQVEQASCW